MSYILEALRKSQRERQLGQAPSLPVVLADSNPPPRRMLPWILLAVLLGVNFGILLYYGFGERTANPSPLDTAAVERPQPIANAADVAKIADAGAPPVAVMPESKPNADARRMEKADIPAAIAVKPKLPEPLDETTALIKPPPAEQVAAINKQPVDRKIQPSVSQTAPQKKANPRDDQASERIAANTAVPAARSLEKVIEAKPGSASIPLLSAMPAGIRERIPPLSINVLAYSAVPKERFAVINMAKYTSGDQLPGGAVLLEIRADGVVLELDGSKFRLTQR